MTGSLESSEDKGGDSVRHRNHLLRSSACQTQMAALITLRGRVGCATYNSLINKLHLFEFIIASSSDCTNVA